MDKAYIFYGPDHEFESYVAENITGTERTDFSEFIRRLDEKSRRLYVAQDGDEQFDYDSFMEVENLVVSSDEYASVRDNVILNFAGFLSTHRIENLFVQNPPLAIAKKLEFLASDSVVRHYEYPRLTKPLLKTFHQGFDEAIVGQETAFKDLLISLYSLTRKAFRKPVVILFFGPSGVGKTETAKFLSKHLGGELFRKQMSMFQNSDFMTYLFGGNHQEDSFAKDLLKRKTNVILLDEFDKANPVFHSAFYQLFDEGMFVDKNHTAMLDSPVIICTSNYTTKEEVRNQLGDPIFSRFDAMVRFDPLGPESSAVITKRLLKREIRLLDADEAKLLEASKIEAQFEPYYKNLKNARLIERLVKEVVYSKLLAGLLDANDHPEAR